MSLRGEVCAPAVSQRGGRGVPARRAEGTGAEPHLSSRRQRAPASARLLWARGLELGLSPLQHPAVLGAHNSVGKFF